MTCSDLRCTHKRGSITRNDRANQPMTRFLPSDGLLGSNPPGSSAAGNSRSDNSPYRKFAPFLRSLANKKRMLTISGFITRYRPVASAMSITMTVNVEHPNMTQPVHETAPMLPASRSRCHSATKYRVKTCGRVAASSPTMATIPKTTSIAIIRRSLRSGATLVLSGFITS